MNGGAPVSTQHATSTRRRFWSRRRAALTTVLVGVIAASSTYLYVLYFEPRTSCTVLHDQTGQVQWTLRNATYGSLQYSCFQFEHSGHGQLGFAATPIAVDIIWANGDMNAVGCHPFLGIGYCPSDTYGEMVIAWNSTHGTWGFNYTEDAYGYYAIAFGFRWENNTLPPPQEWVNFTLEYGQ